jgi:biotin carboxyl carrier protein
MKIYADIRDVALEFELNENNGDSTISIDGQAQNYSLQPLGENRYSLLVGQRSYRLQMVRSNGTINVMLDGEYFPIRVEDERMRTMRELVQASGAGSAGDVVVAPIPGLLTKINVAVGDKVHKGQGLLILEAMKMENEIKASGEGTVKKILAEEGKPVEKDQQLIIIE